MALFLCQVQTIQCSAGRSAVAAAAYRSGDFLIDDRLAMGFDFASKDGIEHTEIMAPANAPAAHLDRRTLWNAVEFSESRKDSVPAREVLIALPHEFDFAQRRELVREFVSAHIVARGMIADVAMLEPGMASGHEVQGRVSGREASGDGFDTYALPHSRCHYRTCHLASRVVHGPHAGGRICRCRQ